MNYSKGNIKKRLEELRSNSRRRANRVSMFLTHMAIIGLIGAIIIGTSAGYGAFQGIKNSTPNVKVTDIIPKGYYSVVRSSPLRMSVSTATTVLIFTASPVPLSLA